MAKIPAYNAAELDDGQIVQINLEGREPIALYKVEGQFYATEDTCSHGAASLSEGDIEDFDVICPFHDGGFDFRTGEVTIPPCVTPIASYPVSVEGDTVFIELPD